MDFQGIPIKVTHEPGSMKLGKTPDGRGWMTRMKAARGVIKGLDGEGRREVKAWIGPNPESAQVYRIEQQTGAGEHDEEKLLLGFNTPVEAAEAIMGHYPEGKHPIRSIHQLPIGGLEDWIADGEAWAGTAHEHHGRPHEHKGLMAFFEGKRIPVEPVEMEEVEELTKAHEPVQDGDRWITVHPNGPGTKGNAVLLRPVKGQPGVHRVVGGAGGKLNFLRVNLTKSPEDYKKESLERRTQKRAQEKEAWEKMTPEEQGAHKAKEAAIKENKTKAEKEFIKSVLGDDTQDGETPDLFEEGPEADPKAAKAYHRERLRQAFAACKEAERAITLDAESRLAAGLAQVGGSATPGLAIDAILTPKSDKGVGYDRAIKERAEANGLTAEKLAAASASWKEANGIKPKAPKVTEPGAPVSEDETSAAIETHVATKELQKQRAEAMAQAVNEALADKTKLAGLLSARAELRQAYEKAIEAKTGRTFLPGFIATMSEPSPEDKERLVADLSEQILRSHVSQFLDEVEQNHPEGDTLEGGWTPQEEEGMAAARGAAAWGALHEAGLAVFGQGILDRDTVETLGGEAAAQVMARAVRARFSHADQAEILKALETQHTTEQESELPAATEEAQRLRAEAMTAKEQLLTTPRDFAAAAEIQKTRLDALKQARTVLASALGRFESRAALIAALKSTPATNLQVPLGRTSPEKAIQAAAAMGLMPDDYALDHQGGEAVLTIPEAGQDKLVKPVDQHAVAQRELAIAIKRGELDEKDYRPQGFADRTASRYDNPLMEPKVFQRQIELPEGAMEEHLGPSLERYIGQRWADGHRATDINADLRGMAAKDMVPDHLHGHLDRLVNKLIPTHEVVKGEDGEPIAEVYNGEKVRDTAGNIVYKTRMREPKQIAADIAALGRKYLDNEGAQDTLEGQTVDSDHPDFREALHRAIAEDPRTQAAHAPVGELTHLQQKAVRDWFYQEHHGKRGQELTAALDALGPEPPKFDETTGGMSLFEDLGPVENPAWVEHQQKKQALLDKFSDKPGESPWGKYIESMGGLKAATEAIQGEMQGKLAERFHNHYSRITGKQLQLGTGDIAHYSTHLKATAGAEKAAELEAERKAKQAQMQKQGGGKFKSVRTKEKMEQAGEASLFGQGGALFGSDEMEAADETPEGETPKWEKPEAGPGERLRLGARMEAQIRAAMPNAAEPFQTRDLKPVKVQEGMNMSGRFAPQQRGVKAFDALSRMGLFYGAGSGKTSVMMGGASQVIHSGKVKKVMMAVPSIVQGQFGAEAANFLDPVEGIKIHARPGESFEERLAAYRDPEKHAVVITHQGLRDDSVKMMAQHMGKTEDEAAKWAMEAKPEELRAALKSAFEAHGASFQALMVDEGHDALNRKGKPDSLLAKIIDAHGHNSSHYIGATGSPVKNDPSEAFDWLHKIDPAKYPKEAQGEFMRRYGSNTAVTRRALKAEISRYFFSERVGSGVTAHHRDETIGLDAEQRATIEGIERASAKLRLGDPNTVKWAKELAPRAFEGKPEAEHEAIAAGVKRAVGTFKEAAMDRAINIGGAKAKAAVQMAKDRIAEGKPVVIFAHRLESVEHLHKALEAAGIKVASITGKDSSKDKPAKLGLFQRGEVDVLVASDAAATGANLQRGKVLIHMDQPMTYKTHEQRTARIDRLGQTQDVEVANLLADHEYDRKSRERVGRKQGLADIFQSKEGYLDDTGLSGMLRHLRARENQANELAS